LMRSMQAIGVAFQAGSPAASSFCRYLGTIVMPGQACRRKRDLNVVPTKDDCSFDRAVRISVRPLNDRRIILLLSFVLLASCEQHSDDVSAKQIAARMSATYASARSYRDRGGWRS